MPIKTTCPNCDAPYTLGDTMEGKKVRCKECEETFTVAANGKKPKRDEEILDAKVRTRPSRSEPDDADDERPAKGSHRRSDEEDEDEDDRPRPKARARRAEDEEQEDDDDRPRKKAKAARGRDDGEEDEEDEDRPSRGKRQGRDDDEDEDEDAPRRKRGSKKAGNSMMWIIIGSAAAVVLLGGGIGLYIATRPSDDPEAQLRQIFGDDPGKIAQDFKTKAIKEFPKDIKVGEIPFFEKEKTLSLAECLQNLKSGDDRSKTQAVNYFGRTDPNVPERAEVAKALEPLVDAPKSLGGVNRAFTTWATKEQAPLLVKLVQKDKGPSNNGLAMLALGRLKDDSGVDAIADHLGDIFARDNALKAFKEYGPDAETGLVRNLFHKNGNTREEVQKLVMGLATPTDKIYPQAVKDLSNTEKESRKAAANWLAQNAVTETYRADVSKGLESMLSNPDIRLAALKALETWATKDNVPALALLLGQDNVPRGDIIRVLANLKDDRAAEALAGRLPTGDRQQAAAALREIGPGAEKAVLVYLNHADGGVNTEARKLLKEWKTKNETLLDQTIKDLTGAMDANQRRPPLAFLTQAEVDDMLRGKVGKAIEPLLADTMVQGDAYKAFFHWAGRENLPTLIKMITNQGPYRTQAMDAGAKLKDENAALAIASNIVLPGGDRGHAVKVLKTMGPVAERAVAPMCLNKDAGIRIDALHILREIGTRASIPFVLQAMKLDAKNKNLVKAGQEAWAAMQGR